MSDWRYTLTEPYTLHVPEFAGKLTEDYVHEWFTLATNGDITINPRYAWDGATGWSDGPAMAHPPEDLHVDFFDASDMIRVLTRGTLGHDIIYQFMELLASILGMRVSEVRLAADILLAIYARIDGAKDWRIVKLGVRLLGGVYHGAVKLLKKLCFWRDEG